MTYCKKCGKEGFYNCLRVSGIRIIHRGIEVFPKTNNSHITAIMSFDTLYDGFRPYSAFIGGTVQCLCLNGFLFLRYLAPPKIN